MRTLLIGAAPGPNTNPDMPLYPLPRTSAGGRLQALMGISRGSYLLGFERMNLLRKFPGKEPRGRRMEDKFPVVHARIAADAVQPLLRDRQVVLIGRNVATAFGLRDLPFHEWVSLSWLGFDGHLAIVPHTSGRCIWYNSEENREISRAFWAEHVASLRREGKIPLAHPARSHHVDAHNQEMELVE